MWCKQCQQDVPAVPAAETDAYSCPRCGEDLLGGAVSAASGAADAESFRANVAPETEAPETEAPEIAPLDSSVPMESAANCVVEVACAAEPPLVAEPVFVSEAVIAADSTFMAEPVPEQAPMDSATDQPPSFDGWELDEELRHIQRILAVEKATTTAPRSPMDFYTRLDAAHRTPSRRGGETAQRSGQRQDSEATTVGWLSALISIVLSIGLMAFAFGGVLLVWSFITGRQDLWTFGMPIAMAGQIVLLMGFILQMDRLWHDSRSTAAKLEHVDERLDDLRSTADVLGGSHRPPPPNYYGGPMAGSLDSQLMLADLKSQLDLLALKMGNQKGPP